MTDQKLTTNSNSDNFNEFLKDYKTDVVNQHQNGYYPFSVVADAYEKGLQDGTAKSKDDLLNTIIGKQFEQFTFKVQHFYILSRTLITYIQENEFIVFDLHLKITPQNLKGIIVIPEQQNFNDSFIELAYNKLADLGTMFSEVSGDDLDLSFIGNENLETDLLKQDGFNYSENYTNG